MAQIDIKLTGRWIEFRNRTDARKFEQRLRRSVKDSHIASGTVIQKTIRNNIRGSTSRYQANHPFNIWKKRVIYSVSRLKPLVRTGLMRDNVRYRIIDWRSVFIGVLHKNRNDSRLDTAQIAQIVHGWDNSKQPILIRITPGMRRYLELGFKLAGLRPIKKSTKYIKIPNRPFVTPVFSDKTIIRKVVSNWYTAIDNALNRNKGGYIRT